MGDPDNIYYNISLFNDGKSNSLAQVTDRRQGAILSNTSEYEGSIIRFTIDADWPLFIPQIPDPAFPLKTNISITFRFGGVFFQQFVNVSPDEAKYGVFGFSIFLDNLNTTARLAHTAMKAAFPAAPGAYPPYFALNAPNGLISMYVDDGWLDNIGVPNLIYFNTYLQALLGFPYNSNTTPPAPSGTDFQIAVKPNSNILPPTPQRYGYPYALNGLAGNILQVSQEFKQLSAFSDINTIMFTTNLLPIVPEYTPFSSGLIQSSNTSDSFIPIITDFVANRSDDKPRDNSFVYLPTAEYRMFSMGGNMPLTGIDIKANYTTFSGGVYQMHLPPGGSMTLKLLFRKRRI